MVLLYCIVDVMFNFFENDKLFWEICSSKVALFCILPLYFQFEGGTRKYVTKGENKFK